ncbi:gliding motility protein [Leptolyngbya sp. Heron Island J]|uniref:hypothetical protein n=1 Tax=Leptolyngbya sp. Heron Island J TaxID=1385935 RepID=UPI0003B9E5DC|nr:hypothetical protein [Leptolyngbya sp. Heron Island J]ESA37863.1 gliding motility protein [Leptolyngbya sp. Heron Island J]ESA38109.1 gliding motility protein [Leptolyngbya sp. Heron Island J]
MGISLNAATLFSRVNARTRQFSRGLFQAGGGLSAAGAAAGSLSLVNHLKGFAVGAVLQAIPSMIWSFSSLWTLFFQSTLQIFSFDWNRPDEALDQQVRNQWTAYGSVLGSVTGSTIGYLACGVLPATSLFAIDERMALYVTQQVGEEFIDEFIGQAAFAIRLAARNLVQQGAFDVYKNVRRWLKEDSNPILNTILGSQRAEEIKATWGEQSANPFTIYGAIDEQVERIPSAFWRNFTEEMIEEVFDSCIEAGYVVAYSLDGWFAQQRMAQQEAERVVEVQPDRTNDREKIVLAGPESHVKAGVSQALVSHQLIQSRDVGQLIGAPVDDYVREKELSLRIKFQLYSVDAPPYITVGANAVQRVTITVPDVKRSALDWQQLRAALGGPNGYLWGRWRATARLGKNEYVSAFGATADEAEDRIRAVMTLSNSVIQTVTVTEERRADERIINPRLQKNVTRVYPGHVTVVNRQRVLAADQGRVSVNGSFIDRQARFELWRDTAPRNFQADIAELLRFA